MIPQETIEEIFQTALIEEVIGEFVQLKKSGSNYKALSPFTDEKTPSFVVSPAKQIFKCFSSGKGGNVVSFLMEHEHFSYPEALRWLANKYGIEIQEEEKSAEQIAAQNERESLYIVNTFARDYFAKSMFETAEGRAVGLSYFKERGFTEEIIKKFELGFCPAEGISLTEAAKKEGHKIEFLEKLGLTKKHGNRTYDFFHGRVMFPIHNLTGRVVGFGGRTLRKDKKTAKYFNSPESDIYNKSKVLYGLYQAKNAIIKYDTCLLVEGYTDVISMHQAGVENVVASSGTSLTEGQIGLIRRYTNNITILFDGDAAGVKASFRGIDMILEQGLNVKVVLFPEGSDPDSFAQEHSEAEVKEYIEQESKDFITFKTGLLLEEANKDPIKKADLIKDIIHSISLIPDPITQSVYVKESSERFDMNEQSLITTLNKYKRERLKKEAKRKNIPQNLPPEPELPKPEQPVQDDELIFQEKDIVRILLNYGEEVVLLTDEDGEEHEVPVAEWVIHELEHDEITLKRPVFKEVYRIYQEYVDKETVPNEQVFFNHEQEEIRQLAVNMVSSNYELSTRWEEKHHIFTLGEKDKLKFAVQNAVFSFKLKKVMEMIYDIQRLLKQQHTDEEMIELLNKQKILFEAKKLLSDQLGRIVIK